MKNLVILSLIAFSSYPAFAADVTKQFLNSYSGKFVEGEFRENFVINKDGAIQRMEVRQVGGGDDSKVPYPTVCSYVYRGKINSVIKRDQADRNEYMDFATHVIEVEYDSVALTDELESTTTANPDCQTFLNENLKDISNGGSLNYSYYSELLSADSLRTHTSGGGDYQQGGERTPSTLDEVYSRVEK